MQIVFLFYENMTALDAVGPHEILSHLPQAAVERVAKTLQLALEYDPMPPYDAGSPAKADPELLAALRQRMVGKFEPL